MSLTQSQQYYLQSMGIDLYVSREKPDNHKSSQTDDSIAVMTLSQLQQTLWLRDVCLALNLQMSDIKSQPNNMFEFGQLLWQFKPQDQAICLKDNKLLCGPLDELTTPTAKRALWGSICEHLDRLSTDKS